MKKSKGAVAYLWPACQGDRRTSGQRTSSPYHASFETTRFSVATASHGTCIAQTRLCLGLDGSLLFAFGLAFAPRSRSGFGLLKFQKYKESPW